MNQLVLEVLGRAEIGESFMICPRHYSDERLAGSCWGYHHSHLLARVNGKSDGILLTGTEIFTLEI